MMTLCSNRNLIFYWLKRESSWSNLKSWVSWKYLCFSFILRHSSNVFVVDIKHFCSIFAHTFVRMVQNPQSTSTLNFLFSPGLLHASPEMAATILYVRVHCTTYLFASCVASLYTPLRCAWRFVTLIMSDWILSQQKLLIFILSPSLSPLSIPLWPAWVQGQDELCLLA